MQYTKLGQTGLNKTKLSHKAIFNQVEASLDLSAEEVAFLDELYRPHPIVGAL